MTTLANTISSTAETTFSSIPNGITQLTSDNSLKLATTAYVEANVNALTASSYLNTNTDQTLTGTTIVFSQTQIVTNVDTIEIGDTLVVGKTADAGITLGQNGGLCSLYIKEFLQPITNIWKYWGCGSINTTPGGTDVSSTSTAVLCKKILSGSFAISTLTTTIGFSPVFTNKPVIILSIRSTSGTVGLNQNKWLTGVDANGFTANVTTTSTTLIMNWFAIGD